MGLGADGPGHRATTVDQGVHYWAGRGAVPDNLEIDQDEMPVLTWDGSW